MRVQHHPFAAPLDVPAETENRWEAFCKRGLQQAVDAGEEFRRAFLRFKKKHLLAKQREKFAVGEFVPHITQIRDAHSFARPTGSIFEVRSVGARQARLLRCLSPFPRFNGPDA